MLCRAAGLASREILVIWALWAKRVIRCSCGMEIGDSFNPKVCTVGPPVGSSLGEASEASCAQQCACWRSGGSEPTSVQV